MKTARSAAFLPGRRLAAVLFVCGLIALLLTVNACGGPGMTTLTSTSETSFSTIFPQTTMIMTMGAETQPLDNIQPTIWRWDVTAKEEGRHRLHLSLIAHLLEAGSDVEKTLKTFDRDIEVVMTPGERVESVLDNATFQWGMGTLLAVFAAVVGWLSYRVARRPKTRKP